MKYSAFLITATLLAITACSGEQQQQEQSVAGHTYRVATVEAKLIGVNVDATTKVHIAENGGVVTLSGEAKSTAERDRYVSAAQSVSGVTSVRDDLVVNPRMHGIQQDASDAAIDVRVSAAIASQAGTNVFQVSPSSNHGIVMLRGTVPSHSVQATIDQTAAQVPGVKRVIDRMAVGSQ